MVVAQLRRGPGETTEDACSVRWNVMDVERPAHLPETPAVRTEPAGTEFDQAAALSQVSGTAVALYSGTDDDDDEADAPQSPALITPSLRTKRSIKRVRIAPLN